jgi:hypothetical protein
VLSETQIVIAAQDLRLTLDQILREDMGCFGIVSLAHCHDVIVHLHRDIDRLYALHQKLVHPAKHVAYTAFWIRKVKPVASAFHLSDIDEARKKGSVVDEGLEVTDINERIALYYIWRLVETYVVEEQIQTPPNLTTNKFIKRLSKVFRNFVDDISPGPTLNNRFEAVVYDMRYRTFGPHHLVHIAHYLLKEATRYGRN